MDQYTITCIYYGLAQGLFVDLVINAEYMFLQQILSWNLHILIIDEISGVVIHSFLMRLEAQVLEM